jgi:hypothetical protein
MDAIDWFLFTPNSSLAFEKKKVKQAFSETDKALLAEQVLQYQKSHEKSLVPFPVRGGGSTRPDSGGGGDANVKYAWFWNLFKKRKQTHTSSGGRIESGMELKREPIVNIGRTAGTTATVIDECAYFRRLSIV